METQPAQLRERMSGLMLADEQRLRRRLDSAVRIGDDTRRAAAYAGIAGQVIQGEVRVAGRAAAVPTLTYPAALPVSQKKDQLLAAIRDHQVVIVAGETGSGKTTQLPKICLELGRGIRGMIGHTQPRRLAARTVADRIAEETGTVLGAAVGWKVRFTDQVGDQTLVKLMTDGILLAEIQRDRELRQYDTLILDEAHERSLNVDFLLGYLKQLLPRRPDLKLVITSATIDPARFARHFGDTPVVEVSGRTFPVEVRYRPLVADSFSDSELESGAEGTDEDDGGVRDQTQAICEAADELMAEGPGDILVFLSGEREIRDTADALARARSTAGVEIVPLYARLSAADQHRVFAPHPGRRIVLATNVAETSLTVPGIRYVIDPGTARISRYSHRLKVQRLPIEAISQASANQRKGRCGRTSDGICIRLFSESDFESRPEFTDPEILRTNLASVILAMTALGLGDIAAFPFLDPPDRRQIADGVQLLEELGALDPAARDPRRRLTPLGRTLAQLPIDPRMARMVVEADRNGCVGEVMVIAAALSIQDPRERPLEKQQAADESHRRFADDTSDFVAYLNLWNYLRDRQEALSSNQFRRLCKAEYLHYLRIREWQDLYAQLRSVAKSLGFSVSDTPAEPQTVHLSLLAGLLSHLGLWDPVKRDYAGARGARFALWPGSALARKPAQWVMAGELVETSRLWGRDVARIDPLWAEPLAQHLVKRTYSEPHWERKRGAVMAYERVTLYGVPIVASRKIAYGGVDPQLSRELFIRSALVEGDWSTQHRFFADNQQLREDVEELEHRVRRRDLVVDDEDLFDFYDKRVPADVVAAAHFDKWWKGARRDQPELLTFTESVLLRDPERHVSAADYPHSWRHGDVDLALTYQFEPGSDADGVTVHIPLAVLNRVTPAGFDWQIPGLRLLLVSALIKSLPKALRRNFVPAPDFAAAVLARLEPGAEPFCDALAGELRAMTGVTIPHDAWELARVPDHLRMTFRVEDGTGAVLGEGKDLDALKKPLAPEIRATVAQAAAGIETRGLTNWTIPALPWTFERPGAGAPVKGFPSLVDEGDSVAVRVLATESEQRQQMRTGTRRLLMLAIPSPLRAVVRSLDVATKLRLGHNPYGSVPLLLEDCVACAIDSLVADAGGPAWDGEAFGRLRDAVRGGLVAATGEVVGVVADILRAAYAVEVRLAETTAAPLQPAVRDLTSQLAGLRYPGFVSAAGRRRLPHLIRYLRAMEQRLDSLPSRPDRDRDWMAAVEIVQREYDAWLAGLPPTRMQEDAAREIRWLIEELRVSMFAQTLGTPAPVSAKRIYRAMDELAP